jgi:hypothetical protein
MAIHERYILIWVDKDRGGEYLNVSVFLWLFEYKQMFMSLRGYLFFIYDKMCR